MIRKIAVEEVQIRGPISSGLLLSLSFRGFLRLELITAVPDRSDMTFFSFREK